MHKHLVFVCILAFVLMFSGCIEQKPTPSKPKVEPEQKKVVSEGTEATSRTTDIALALSDIFPPPPEGSKTFIGASGSVAISWKGSTDSGTITLTIEKEGVKTEYTGSYTKKGEGIYSISITGGTGIILQLSGEAKFVKEQEINITLSGTVTTKSYTYSVEGKTYLNRTTHTGEFYYRIENQKTKIAITISAKLQDTKFTGSVKISMKTIKEEKTIAEATLNEDGTITITFPDGEKKTYQAFAKRKVE